MPHAHGVSEGLDLLGFLVLGLLGSAAHCSVMCGPFVLLVSDRYAQPRCERPVMRAQLWYAAGRAAAYAALGAAAGYAGAWLQLAGGWAGIGRAAATFAGAALVLSALMHITHTGVATGSGIGRVTRLLYRRLPSHPFSLGLVLGLLPCGLLYSAIVAAVARGSAAEGALALSIFAAGTMPSLIGLAAAELHVRRRAAGLVPVAHGFVLLMGLWYLWRGLAG